MILVKLATAVICFSNQCYPALVGEATPVGEFPVHLMEWKSPGYGGDVLAFARDDKGYFAIHRLWLLNPKQHRLQRLESRNAKDHIITNGCINVSPEVYERLKECCTNEKLVITR